MLEGRPVIAKFANLTVVIPPPQGYPQMLERITMSSEEPSGAESVQALDPYGGGSPLAALPGPLNPFDGGGLGAAHSHASRSHTDARVRQSTSHSHGAGKASRSRRHGVSRAEANAQAAAEAASGWLSGGGSGGGGVVYQTPPTQMYQALPSQQQNTAPGNGTGSYAPPSVGAQRYIGPGPSRGQVCPAGSTLDPSTGQCMAPTQYGFSVSVPPIPAPSSGMLNGTYTLADAINDALGATHRAKHAAHGHASHGAKHAVHGRHHKGSGGGGGAIAPVSTVPSASTGIPATTGSAAAATAAAMAPTAGVTVAPLYPGAPPMTAAQQQAVIAAWQAKGGTGRPSASALAAIAQQMGLAAVSPSTVSSATPGAGTGAYSGTGPGVAPGGTPASFGPATCLPGATMTAAGCMSGGVMNPQYTPPTCSPGSQLIPGTQQCYTPPVAPPPAVTSTYGGTNYPQGYCGPGYGQSPTGQCVPQAQPYGGQQNAQQAAQAAQQAAQAGYGSGAGSGSGGGGMPPPSMAPQSVAPLPEGGDASSGYTDDDDGSTDDDTDSVSTADFDPTVTAVHGLPW
jgi:hypothetical protein